MAEDNPFDHLADELHQPFNDMGGEMVEQVRDWLAQICTVFHHIAGAGDHRHSRPGEHPRYETGALLESIVAEVATTETSIAVTIGSDVPYAATLQLSMDRPIFTGIEDLYLPMLEDGAHAALISL